MNLFFWRRKISLADVLIAAMDAGYVIRKQGRNTYVFTIHSSRGHQSRSFAGERLRNRAAYEGMLEELIAEAGNPLLPVNHSGMKLDANNWKK